MGTGVCTSVQLQFDDVSKRESPLPKKHKPKMLFLGSAGSGKTTFCKQLHKIHGQKSFKCVERKRYLPYIWQQCIDQMKVALTAVEERMMLLHGYCRQSGYNLTTTLGDDILAQIFRFQFGMTQLSSSGNKAAKVVAQLDCSDRFFDGFKTVCDKYENAEIAAIETLWAEPIIKEMYEIRTATNIEESSAYFWNMLDVLNDPIFVPDLDHIMKLSRGTTGIQMRDYAKLGSEFPFTETFRIIHVGGHKLEREQWKTYHHHYEGLSAVIFVASLSCYDELMVEDPQKNRMTDQLELFRQILNEEIVRDIPVILLLTKKDLFMKKIENVPLSECDSFASYDSHSLSYWHSLRRIQDMFWSAAQWGGDHNEQMQNRKLFVRFVNALDTEEVGRVWDQIWRHVVKGESVPLIDREPQEMDDLYRVLVNDFLEIELESES